MKKTILAALLILSQITFSQTVDLGFGNFPGYTIGQQDYSYYDMLIIDQNIFATSTSISEAVNVSKYDLNGILDNTFGQNGFKNISGADILSNNMFTYTKYLHKSADNKLLVISGYDFDTTNKVLCTKLNLDGTLDASYGVSGQVLSSITGKFVITAVQKLSNDELLILGRNSLTTDESQNTLLIIKINAQGIFDSSFGINGVFQLPPNLNSDEAIFDGESIYFLHRESSVFVTKFDLTTLNFDLNFAVNGELPIADFFPNQAISSFSVENNNIYILGDFTNNNQSMETFVAKYTNESIDSTFGINGIARFPILNTDNPYINSFSIKRFDDTLFIMGEILAAESMGQSGSFMAKLNSDGSIDESFGTGGVYVDTLFDISTLPTNYLYLDDAIIMAGMTLLPEIFGQPFMAKYQVQNNLAISQNTVPNFSFYPNPVADFLHFQNAEEVSSIAIYDVVGRLVKSTFISEDMIDLSFLKSGNYILKATTASNVLTFKILKI